MSVNAPWKSLTFSAPVLMEQSSFDVSQIPSEKPIKIVARTGGEAHQEYWGRCIHDMAGFIQPEGAVNLDYAHRPDESIGCATVKVVNNELVAEGKLIPFKPDDAASQVIFKGSRGVPFQASIVMNPKTVQIRKVREGESIAVNGQNFTGPLTVFTSWGIDGIAVLPYGSDSETSVEFARGKPDVQISILEDKDVQPMTDTVVTAPVNVPAPIVVEKPNPDNFSRSTALQYKTDFGSKGVDWYIEGKTYAEAAKLFGEELKQEADTAKAESMSKDEKIKALEEELAELKSKSEFRRGQPAPVPSKPTDGEPAKPVADMTNFGRSKGMQNVIDSIKRRMTPKA